MRRKAPMPTNAADMHKVTLDAREVIAKEIVDAIISDHVLVHARAGKLSCMCEIDSSVEYMDRVVEYFNILGYEITPASELVNNDRYVIKW